MMDSAKARDEARAPISAGAKLLFLDIDGVLNRHEPHGNGFNGIHPDCAGYLNVILAATSVQLVISSAWRYMILRGAMTVSGFEHLLCTHGIDAHERIHGHTAEDRQRPNHLPPYDPEQWQKIGLLERSIQIREYWHSAGHPQCVVLDDLPLDCANLVQTDPAIGLTANLAELIISRLDSRKVIAPADNPAPADPPATAPSQEEKTEPEVKQ